ncbi:histidine kinase [Epilithonimonas xixisoli]|uniref:Histidine kinase n=1 Tax=Epilithonimonas xixisoli TaxID=1476462 RepID=A0A4R8IBT0_9FLAO|nr:histidine kinase [Epilithonimonas xixisoli]TDX87174.1 histidine kinase [Epilithonimonas xixisoli]
MNGRNLLIPDYFLFGGIFALFLLIVLCFFLYGKYKSAKTKNKILEDNYKSLENKLDNVRLDHIETKLNPHLFKNILNSVQSHAYQTYISLDKLANILDYILYESNNKYVSPKEELDFTMSLIDINKIKINPLFDLRIKSKIDKEDSIFMEKIFAPLITVDLIENAFKHTDFLAQDSFISIHLNLETRIFEMKVSNKISAKTPMEKENSGFGSSSFDQRLKMIYKEHYKLSKSINSDIYTAQLKINLGDFYDKMRYTR